MLRPGLGTASESSGTDLPQTNMEPNVLPTAAFHLSLGLNGIDLVSIRFLFGVLAGPRVL